jgi:hemolysin activation/secretion protein
MPLMRRAGRPGLLGTAARTAVVVGTAGAVSSRQQQRAQQRDAEQQPEAPAAPAAPPAPAAPAPPPADDLPAQLQRLGDLHAAGTLTADEFAAAKARLLG